ncbi:MAG: hypothetical protein KZQ92_18880 [Candidatus Thiodiazotropha sp. (ex Lucinoma borealis)]|nr:hypothetical protein [Candidatus Thiodiazotropha sp. (ex Lucinoma borealis)]
MSESNIFLSDGAFQFYAAIIIAYLVYRLGLNAYHKQKSYEQVVSRYLTEGLDIWTSQCDYALSVFRCNWALMLRVIKEYREYDIDVNVNDFFKEFIELDYAHYQIGPNSRIKSLISTNVFWNGYQSVFAFVTTANDAMKADFGVALKKMVETPNHPGKAGFLEVAKKMSDEQDIESKPFYEIVSIMFHVSELFAKSNYSKDDMHKFSLRYDVREKVEEMHQRLTPEDDNT